MEQRTSPVVVCHIVYYEPVTKNETEGINKAIELADRIGISLESAKQSLGIKDEENTEQGEMCYLKPFAFNVLDVKRVSSHLFQDENGNETELASIYIENLIYDIDMPFSDMIEAWTKARFQSNSVMMSPSYAASLESNKTVNNG